jgi:hypothetical protein
MKLILLPGQEFKFHIHIWAPNPIHFVQVGYLTRLSVSDYIALVTGLLTNVEQSEE